MRDALIWADPGRRYIRQAPPFGATWWHRGYRPTLCSAAIPTHAGPKFIHVWRFCRLGRKLAFHGKVARDGARIEEPIARDPFRQPGAVNLDLGLFRRFPIRELLNLEFRAEAANSTNTPHFNNPNSNISPANFLVVASAQPDHSRMDVGAESSAIRSRSNSLFIQIQAEQIGCGLVFDGRIEQIPK